MGDVGVEGFLGVEGGEKYFVFLCGVVSSINTVKDVMGSQFSFPRFLG